MRKNESAKTRMAVGGGIVSPLNSLVIKINNIFPRFNQKAFTLAEVLVTLTIIGVASALTVPTLHKKYQQVQYASAFKQGYSLLAQAAKSYLAENETFYPTGQLNYGGRPWIDDFNKYVKSTYVKKVGYQGSGYTSYNGKSTAVWDNGGPVYQLPTGSTVHVTCWYGEATVLYLDLNGASKPNRLGYDVFIFSLDDEKGLIPNSSGDCSINTSMEFKNGTTCAKKALSNANYFKELFK